MDIKLEFDQETINKKIVDSIINSAIGDQIEKAVNEALTKNVGGLKSETLVQQAISKGVSEAIDRLVREMINEKKDVIREAISSRMTDEFLSNLSIKGLDAIKDAAYREKW